jgi:release factor glutamine methyltransferase
LWFDVVDKGEKSDLIVSNPPYIDPDDTHLAALTHEPITALTAPQQELADLVQIVAGAERHLLVVG